MPLTHILNNPQISLACLLHLHHVQLNTRSLAGQELPLGVLSQGLNGKQSSQIELKASKPHWVPKKRVETSKPVTSKNLGLPNRGW
jgi:hypothetical protein